MAGLHFHSQKFIYSMKNILFFFSLFIIIIIIIIIIILSIY